jgi:hypothetical protein
MINPRDIVSYFNIIDGSDVILQIELVTDS